VCEELPQHRTLPDGFLAEDVERHPCQVTLVEYREQSRLVDQAASRAVHQEGTPFEQAQFSRANEGVCSGAAISDRSMERDEIGLHQDLFFAEQPHSGPP